MPFSAPKMHFFDKNGNLTPCPAQPSADVKEFIFREIILHQFLKRKNRALLKKNVQAILTLLNLAMELVTVIACIEEGMSIKIFIQKKLDMKEVINIK